MTLEQDLEGMGSQQDLDLGQAQCCHCGDPPLPQLCHSVQVQPACAHCRNHISCQICMIILDFHTHGLLGIINQVIILLKSLKFYLVYFLGKCTLHRFFKK